MHFSTDLLDSILNYGLRQMFGDDKPINLYLYSGAMPASADDDATGTLLCTLVKGLGGGLGVMDNGRSDDGRLGVDGVAPIDGSWSGVASATGTVGYFRMMDANELVVDNTLTEFYRIDGTVSSTAGDLVLSSTSVTSGLGDIYVEQIIVAITLDPQISATGGGTLL